MTPAQQLLALRTHRSPVDAREASSWDEVDQFLTAPPEDQSAIHLTAAGIVVSERGIVLLEHKRLGIWVQPGGHVEPDETLHMAALRESCEETGLAIRHPSTGPRLIHIDAHDGGRGHRHFDFRYLLWGLGTDPQPALDESQLVRWVPLDEAIALADDGLRGLLVSCSQDGPGTVRDQLLALSVAIS